jgi:hypothetical protein
MIKKLTLIVVLLLFALPEFSLSQIMTINGSTTVFLNQGSRLAINGGLNLKAGGTILHSNVAASNLYISGRFNYLGTYTQNDYGILRFFGSLSDTISGNDLTVPRLWITKTGTAMVWLAYGTDLTIQNSLRLVTNNLLNIYRSNLTMNVDAMIYPDSTSTYTTDPLTDPFSANKHITSSGDSAITGTLTRKIKEASEILVDLSLRFPIGTPNDTLNPTIRYYSPVRYVFNTGQASFDPGAYLSLQCIATEHYATEVKNVALKKYWKSSFDKINAAPGGYNIRFNYNDAEVQGFEELYFLCLFYRPFDGVNGTYYINSGAGYGVEPINNRYYVDEVNKKDTLGATKLLLDGEWTAGQEEAISTFYYSRADGDWNNPNTWSKQGYNGVAATTIPSTINDKAFIGNGRTVTITATTNEIDRTIIDNTGKLKIPNPNHQLLGDSLFLKAGGTLAISNANGIRGLGSPLGQIQTSKIRSYSSDAIYEFIGSNNQITGPDIPDIVRSIVVNKNAITDTISLSKSILIKDSLVINQGCLHLYKEGNFTANGETGDTTNRRIRMRGGEFVMQSFPTKYRNGVFTAGTITFDGTGSFRVPSSESPSPGEPSVTQYFNLSFKGSRASNTFVTLDPTGEIRIAGLLDISKLSLNANPAAERFLVTGSKVVFNGSGDQDIQTGYPTPVGINYRLKFHELIIDGTGIKNIMDPNDASVNDDYALIRSFVRIKQGTLKSNNHWIKVLGNWRASPGASFNAGTGLVSFEADGKVTSIESNGTSFNNLRIMGTLANGYVNYIDSLNIAGNLEINPNSLRCLNSASLAIQGNFNNSGAFVANTGRVFFNGASGDQTLTHSGIGTYYRMTVNKNAGMVRITGDSLLKITNDLTLTKGNIGGRTSTPVLNKPLIVDGSITRTGGNPGHVDGRLRLPSVEGTHSITFPVGLGNDYAPMKLDINGPGGAPGYLDAYVLLDTTAPNMGRNVIETQTPNGPELDSTKNVRKVWVLHADTTGSQLFALAASRTYDIEFFFPGSDIRNGANTGVFELGQRDTTINTGRWTKPFAAERNALSTKFTGNQNFNNNTTHFFIVGDPKVFTYYSIADGLFNNVNTWSTAGYESIEPAVRAPLPVDNIRIGNGKTVTLNVDHTINSPRTFIVETGGASYQNGHLIFNSDTRLINGTGTFRLDSGAAITIRHAAGISTTAATGCVQTTNKDYNFNGHNAGHFIYGKLTAGTQSVGNGLPFYIMTMTSDQSTNSQQLTFPAYNIYHIRDSIHIKSGNVVFSNINTKLGGNFIVELNGQYDFGTQTVNASYTGNPSTGQQDSSSARPGGLMFDGTGTQYIHVKRANPDSIIIINRVSLVKPSGKVISKNNINAGQLFFHEANRANYNGLDNNKWIWGRVNVLRLGGFTGDVNTDPGWTMLHDPTFGYVEGRLLRSVNNNRRQFPIGTLAKYAPVDIEIGSVQTGGNGLLEVQAIEGNHPDFDPTQINPNTNIQRYYEITLTSDTASTMVIGSSNNLLFRTRIIFTDDEPRGGINPVNYDAFRLQSTLDWTNTTNILTDSNTTTQLLFNLNTAPRQPNNNIFETTSLFSGDPSIVIMIGEGMPVVPERIFYSRNSGNWTNPSTWSWVSTAFENTEDGYALNSNPGNVYPQYNNGPFKDIVYIGAGDSVYLDINTVNLRYLLLEETVSGTGKLVLPSNSNADNRVINTEQYVQKNGGKLYIGHRRGITDLDPSAANEGCIRRMNANSILNYDWNSLGKNNFAYIRTHDNIQETGAALPSVIGSLTIDYDRNASGRYVQLTNDANLTIRDSLVFIKGRLQNRDGNRTINVQGDIVNYSPDVGFHAGTNPSNRAIILDSTRNQQIRGTSDLTAFPDTLRINKISGNVTANRNVTLNSYLDVRSNTYLNLADNRTLIFGSNGNVNNILNIDSFRVDRMIKVSGGPNTGQLTKIFTTGTNTARTFTFPVGEDGLGLRSPRYGEAKYDLNNMDFAVGNNLTFSLRSNYPHPNAPTLTPNMLSKYWSTNTTGITLNTNGNVNTRFRYNDAEITGNILNYKPAIYRRTDVSSLDPGWSSTIFGATTLNIDTTNKYIIVTAAQTLPYHDWTAGNPTAFAKGKVYWSRTSNLDWTNPNTWTNITNSGVHNSGNISALNYPGYYAGDTVFIGNNHIVNFNRSVENAIDSVGIGITSPSTSPELQFTTAALSNKSLNITRSLMIGSTGKLSKSNAVFNSIDTLRIRRDLSNLGDVGRGVDIHPDIARNIRLEFDGDDSTRILGEGTYTTLGNVRIIKADSIWNTVNKSASFSSRFSTAVTTIPSVNFDLDAGMYVHDVNANITLSTNGDGDVFLGDLVGLIVRNGNITFSDGLICGQNASIWLQNGDLTIGNQVSENFLYESVTIIDVAGISKLKVAGAMRRRFTTSNVDFRLRDNAEIEVMKAGAITLSSERRAAFDFGEANSFFTMSGNSKITIFKPMLINGSLEKDPDYLVSASTFNVTGGTVQFGHPDSTLVGEPFSLIASVPFWNLDIAKTYGKDLFVGSSIATIRNNLTIRSGSIFNQNGNNINIGGDFTIAGQYKAGTLGTRRVAFFGDTTATPPTKRSQTILISSTGNDSFYDFAIGKADSGTVFLSNSGSFANSNLIISNTLEFSVGNRALINTGTDRYVQVGTNSTDLGSIQRFGSGHINGFLRRWINNGVQNRLFPVGTQHYTPALILTTSGTGTEGLLSVKAFGTAHPNIASATDIQTNTHVDRYWQIKPLGSTLFALGDRSFSLTTSFLKGATPTGDVKPGTSFGIYEHFRYTPENPNPGDWFTTVPFARTDSSTTSSSNIAFGDFVIAEIAGERFYSRQTGDWNSASTWFNQSYTGTPAIRAPIQETDRVFIGNGHTVTIQNSNPRVRSVTVEVGNGLPGRLKIVDERYLRGLSFVISDNCFLSTDDAFGFTALAGPTPNIGAVRSSNIRSFGKATYEYIGTQAQAMGDGPVNPKTIIVNNTGMVNNSVSFSPFTYTVEDTILVSQGGLQVGNGLVNLKGNLISQTGTYVNPSLGTLNLNGNADQNFVMNDTSGISIYNLRLTKPVGNLILKGSTDTASLKVLNDITFESGNLSRIDARTNNKKVILFYDTTTFTRTGSGHIDGWLLRQFGTGAANFQYEIGYGSIYMPVILDLTAGTGTAGFVGGIVKSPPSINIARIHPTKRINYYWAVSPWTTFLLGTRTANTTFNFPASQLANLTGGVPNNAILYRKSIPTENPSWKERVFGKLTYNLSAASVSITNPVDYWEGLGEFYISEKYNPVYYSRQTGVWNDNNTWTLSNTHVGIACEPGDFPTSPDNAIGDKAYIGLDHIVTLNINDPVIDTLIVRNDSKLDMGTFSVNCVTCAPVKGLFALQDNATIAFGGSSYPTISTTMKNFANYQMSNTSTIEYTGTQSVIADPFAPFYTSYPGNLRISGAATKYVNVPVLVNRNLFINAGSSLEINALSLQVYGNVVNSGNIFNTKMLEIGN